MKFLVFLSILCFALTTYTHFKTCDDRWHYDTMWIDEVRGSHYTFCHDENTGRDPTYFNSRLITLTADGLNTRGIKCGSVECTPASINNLIKSIGKEGFMRETGIVSADGTSKDVDVDDYLEDYILLNSYVDSDKETFFFMVTGKLNEEYLTGINHDGVDVVVEKSQLVDYMGWKVVGKNSDKELKFLN